VLYHRRVKPIGVYGKSERNGLVSSSGSPFISSKEVMARTGISRATLNNYISLNLIPAPEVRRPDHPGGPTKIGYFPHWVVERIKEIQQLKDQGMRMSHIALHFMGEKGENWPEPDEQHREFTDQSTYGWIERIVFPAIVVNRTWEIMWLNDKGADQVLPGGVRRFPSVLQKNLFGPIIVAELQNSFANWREILLPHMRLAKKELQEDTLRHLYGEADSRTQNEVLQLWRLVDELEDFPLSQQKLGMKHCDGRTTDFTLISWRSHQGTLLLYIPTTMQLDHLIDLAIGKTNLPDFVLHHKAPSPRPLCILAARLQSDLHLRTALPPEEYFALINQIILSANQCCRGHGGIPGRSIQQGTVCFFLQDFESEKEHLFQALLCGQSLQKMIREIDNQWKYKLRWSNTLRMPIGIHCGHEWLGTVPSPLAFECTVVGDTLIQAVKLSEFSQGGAVWASKEVIESLSSHHRERIAFGIRLGIQQERILSPSIYLSIRDLINQGELERKGLQVIRNLVVSEVLNIVV
jgi:class 3 adenylate cyclase/DNA-binding transcriptional MerR regulator